MRGAGALPVKFDFVGNDDCAGIRGVAVVIDVLRAFSFAAYALDAGVDRLILMDDLDATLALSASIPGALAGKDGVPQEGFDLFNSPGALRERSDLAGRTIVHRTSAGTIGAVAARGASDLLCASFVVAEATVGAVAALRPESVTFVITGGGGRSDDDLACAEYLRCRLEGAHPDPTPYLRRVDVVGDGLRRGVELGYRGVHADDVELCMDIDRFNFAMRAREDGGHLTLRAELH
jgi:2-phosphosulfolactate phosphatase